MLKQNNYSKETKLKSAKDLLKGRKTSQEIAKKLSCHPSTIEAWARLYETDGAKAFNENKKNKSYSKEFKEKIVKEYLSGNSSYNYLMKKYNLSSKTLVIKWVTNYNNGIELKDYFPTGDVYAMKARKTTFKERLEIVEYCNRNGLNYKETALKYNLPYNLVYTWTKKYLKFGSDSLNFEKKDYDKTDEQIELEKLKQEVERLKFENEVLKKNEEFAILLNSQRLGKKKNTKQ